MKYRDKFSFKYLALHILIQKAIQIYDNES
jgi:hypothetical protein